MSSHSVSKKASKLPAAKSVEITTKTNQSKSPPNQINPPPPPPLNHKATIQIIECTNESIQCTSHWNSSKCGGGSFNVDIMYNPLTATIDEIMENIKKALENAI
eukprot:260205_1